MRPGGGASGASGASTAAWIDDEPPLGATGRTEVRRLGHRARASWPFWIGAAALVTAGLTVVRALQAPTYTVTAVVRVTEGQMRARGDFGPGALRVHVKELTFTRARLEALIRQHPGQFPAAAREPDAAVEDLRERIKVDVSDGDFVEERRESDPPRSARITLSFTAAAPEDAWRITHALVDLLIDSTLARQRAALLREQAGAESAVDRAEQHSGDQTLADRRSSLGRLKTTDARAADVRLGLRAADEQQALRFELVDPGRIPAKATRAVLFRDATVTFVMALLVACLLAGAFDPRIIDAADISGAGVAVLGHLPLLPSAPGPRASRNTPETPPVSSDDRGPRV